MSAISIKQLLEAGVHFGHQTHRWNPKMKDYIFGERNGIYIIDLQQTLRRFKQAVDFVSSVAAQGKSVLFVGTKRQAQEAVEEEAKRCGMFFVNNRWLGGLLTNFATIQNSIKRYKELDQLREDGFYSKLSKKEAARVERERKKLEKNLRGIRDMDRLPGAVFVIDSNREEIAVREANKLKIPVVAIVDTNADPSRIDYPIPGNDDALRAVRLFASTIADAIIAGRSAYDAKVEAEMREAREKAAKEAAKRREEKKAREEADRARKEALAAAAAAAEASKKAVAGKGADEEQSAEAVADTEAKASETAAEAEVETKSPAEEVVAKKPAAEAEETEKVDEGTEKKPPAKPRKAKAKPKAKTPAKAKEKEQEAPAEGEAEAEAKPAAKARKAAKPAKSAAKKPKAEEPSGDSKEADVSAEAAEKVQAE